MNIFPRIRLFFSNGRTGSFVTKYLILPFMIFAAKNLQSYVEGFLHPFFYYYHTNTARFRETILSHLGTFLFFIVLDVLLYICIVAVLWRSEKKEHYLSAALKGKVPESILLITVFSAIRVSQQALAGFSLHGGSLVAIVMMAYSVVVEEYIFRGFLSSFLRRVLDSRVLGLVTCSLIFAICHFDFSFHSLLDLFLQGCVYGIPILLGYGLWPSIVMHIINNIIATIMY